MGFKRPVGAQTHWIGWSKSGNAMCRAMVLSSCTELKERLQLRARADRDNSDIGEVSEKHGQNKNVSEAISAMVLFCCS